MIGRGAIVAIIVVEAACAFFFVSEIVISFLGLPVRPIDWQLRELIEIAAAVGLILGIVLGGIALSQSVARARRAEEALRLASQAFWDLIEARFTEWRLTPAERDVALFAIKGLSTGEISRLRETSEGTVKAQTNAIYRKAGVRGRAQLLSLFLEDLMAPGDDEATTSRTAAE